MSTDAEKEAIRSFLRGRGDLPLEPGGATDAEMEAIRSFLGLEPTDQPQVPAIELGGAPPDAPPIPTSLPAPVPPPPRTEIERRIRATALFPDRPESESILGRIAPETRPGLRRPQPLSEGLTNIGRGALGALEIAALPLDVLGSSIIEGLSGDVPTLFSEGPVGAVERFAERGLGGQLASGGVGVAVTGGAALAPKIAPRLSGLLAGARRAVPGGISDFRTAAQRVPRTNSVDELIEAGGGIRVKHPRTGLEITETDAFRRVGDIRASIRSGDLGSSDQVLRQPGGEVRYANNILNARNRLARHEGSVIDQFTLGEIEHGLNITIPSNRLEAIRKLTKESESQIQRIRSQASLADELEAAIDVGKADAIERGIRQIGVTRSPPSVVETPQDAMRKLTSLLREAKPVRAETAVLRTEELGKRVARSSEILGQGDPIEAFARARGPLAGELPTAQFTPPRDAFTREEMVPLYRKIRDSDLRLFDKLNTEGALTKLLSGQLPTSSEIARLEAMFGSDLAKAILGHRPFKEKAFEVTGDLLNLPRTVLTSWDASAPLRQGVVLLPGHPKRFAENVVTMFKAMARETNAQAVDDAIKADPNFLRFTGRHAGNDLRNIFIADRTGVARGLAGREEQFMSRFARRIPGIRQSERAYVTFLNKFRFDVMGDIVRGWEDDVARGGKAILDQDLDDLAVFINRATGRGGLGFIDKHKNLEGLAPILNAGFFSPRFVTSRITLPLSALTTTPRVRKQAATDLVKFVGTGIGVLSLLSLADGVTVQTDPRSSDFGKIKIGKTRIDYWGGFQPIARYTAQAITNRRRNLRSDQVVQLSSRGNTLLRFLRSKLGPPTALGVDVLTGRDFVGQEFGAPGEVFGQRIPGPLREVGKRLVPLFIQDMAEAIDEEGLVGGLRALPAFLGTGVQTFDENEPRLGAPIRRDAFGLPIGVP